MFYSKKNEAKTMKYLFHNSYYK